MAHLLRAHLQSCPSQSGSHAQGNASQVLAQPARGPVDLPPDSGRPGPLQCHAGQRTQHPAAQAAAQSVLNLIAVSACVVCPGARKG